MTNETTYSFIHACYVENQENQEDDAVFVKRQKINPDGTIEPELVMYENLERNFWITKPAYRKHTGKLEYEYLSKLNQYRSTQRNLIKNIQRKLGERPDPKKQLRQVCNSPYVYGVDKDITCIVRDRFIKKFGDKTVPLSVGCMDTETDMLEGTNRVIIMAYFFNNVGYIGIDKTWFKEDYSDEYIADYVCQVLPEVKESGATVKCKVVDSSADAIRWVFEQAHADKPDVIGFWNINFDIPVILKVLEDANIDPKDVFSDPSVPKAYRYFKYKQGATTKIMESGRSMPLAPSQQWHTVFSPASFYFIDPSSLYRILRRGKAENSYAMDYITGKVVGSGKYKPDLPLLKGANENGGRWHIAMQKHYKLDYIAYAFMDVFKPVQMDNRIGDISQSLVTLAMGSHFKDFNSNPRRLCDQLHNFFLNEGAVVGSTGSEMETKYDRMTPPSKDWIVTLEAGIIEDFGLKLFEGVSSKIFIHNADLDIVSTYPILGMVFNICRETTLFETCKIEGLGYFGYREFGVNLTGGVANSIILGENTFGLKSPDALLSDFRREFNLDA